MTTPTPSPSPKYNETTNRGLPLGAYYDVGWSFLPASAKGYGTSGQRTFWKAPKNTVKKRRRRALQD